MAGKQRGTQTEILTLCEKTLFCFGLLLWHAFFFCLGNVLCAFLFFRCTVFCFIAVYEIWISVEHFLFVFVAHSNTPRYSKTSINSNTPSYSNTQKYSNEAGWLPFCVIRDWNVVTYDYGVRFLCWHVLLASEEGFIENCLSCSLFTKPSVPLSWKVEAMGKSKLGGWIKLPEAVMRSRTRPFKLWCPIITDCFRTNLHFKTILINIRYICNLKKGHLLVLFLSIC